MTLVLAQRQKEKKKKNLLRQRTHKLTLADSMAIWTKINLLCSINRSKIETTKKYPPVVTSSCWNIGPLNPPKGNFILGTVSKVNKLQVHVRKKYYNRSIVLKNSFHTRDSLVCVCPLTNPFPAFGMQRCYCLRTSLGGFAFPMSGLRLTNSVWTNGQESVSPNNSQTPKVPKKWTNNSLLSVLPPDEAHDSQILWLCYISPQVFC